MQPQVTTPGSAQAQLRCLVACSRHHVLFHSVHIFSCPTNSVLRLAQAFSQCAWSQVYPLGSKASGRPHRAHLHRDAARHGHLLTAGSRPSCSTSSVRSAAREAAVLATTSERAGQGGSGAQHLSSLCERLLLPPSVGTSPEALTQASGRPL